MTSTGIPDFSMLPPDDDRGPKLLAMFWSYCAISIVMVALRFYARIQIRAVSWDDWLMLLTVVIFVIGASFITTSTLNGGARHVRYLTPEQILFTIKYNWIAQPWAVFSFATGKASVAFLILRFIGRNTVYRKYILYFTIATIFIVNGVGCITIFAQCDPPRALWTPETEAKCWDPIVQLHFNYFQAVWNILADIVLAILPATFIANLNLPPQKKYALCILLSLGFIGAIFGGLKIRYLDGLSSRSDFTWNSYDIQVWTGAECFVMMVSGNIPPLQLLWDRFVSKKLDSSYGRTPIKYYHNGTGYSEKINRSNSNGHGLYSLRSITSSNKFPSHTQIISDDDIELPRVPENAYANTDDNQSSGTGRDRSFV
ncbi:hypothetical protein B0H63DRAFT_121401 [Podospora didyma]|uniref:Rhodopsin domain-containing protein n=1 Tax=Podospora didyma TaxID=330526 RepID=A0AAE0NZS4_9PEZI|nr:hypothetical protein B0H63DRAFT_121401 [Podospora didyma]